jgi:HK97 family phage portal protein
MGRQSWTDYKRQLAGDTVRGALPSLPDADSIVAGLQTAAHRAGYDRVLDIGTEAKAGSEGPNLYAVGTTGRPTYPRQSIANWTEEGQRKNELVFACLDKLAQTSAEPTLRAYERGIGRGSKPRLLPDEHPANLPVTFPNPTTSESGMLAQQIVTVHVAGNAVAFKERNDAGLPNGLHWVRLDRVMLEVDGNSQIVAFWYEPVIAAPRVRIPREEVVHFRGMYDLLFPAWGISPLGVMARAVTVDNAATDFAASFFANAAVPYGMISTEQMLLPDDADEIARRWAERYGGLEGWNQPAVLGRGATYQRLGLNMQEMSMDFLRAHDESRICMDFGVPPIMVGAKVGLDRSTFSNMREARESLWEDKAKGYWQDVADQYTLDLGVEFGDRIFYAFDFDNVAALGESRESKWTRATTGWDNGMLMLDDAREIAGLPPLPGGAGQVLKRKMADEYVSMAEIADEAATDPADEPELPEPQPIPLIPPPAPVEEAASATWPTRTARWSKRKRTSAVDAWRIEIDRLRDTYTEAMTARLTEWVDQLGDAVISRAQQGRFVPRKAGKPKPFAGRARELLRVNDERQLTRILSGYFDAIAGDTVATANLTYDLGVIYQDSPARMKALARAARDAQRIVGTVEGDLNKRMAVADRRGWNVTKLVDGDDVEAGIRGTFGKGDPKLPGYHAARDRAGKISQASFTTASNVSAAAAFGEQGITEVMVLDGSGLGDVCDELNGAIWSVEYAADHELEHPNCTRILSPIIPPPEPATEAPAEA